MIVHEIPSHPSDAKSFRLIEQHEHGRVSGDIYRSLKAAGASDDEVRYAVANHDIAWTALDAEVLWNWQESRPYSFIDYPSRPKMEAYVWGIDAVEDHSPYAALLCSAHYGAFVAGSTDEYEMRFASGEKGRRARLRDGLSPEKLEYFERDLSLLRLCDSLSLFICLNEPGSCDHPWYRDGIPFGGNVLRPVWEDAKTLRFEPDVLAAALDVRIPYRVVSRDGDSSGSGDLHLHIVP